MEVLTKEQIAELTPEEKVAYEAELAEEAKKNNPPADSVIKPEDDPKFLRNMAVNANKAAQRESERAQALEDELAALKTKAGTKEIQEEALPSKDEFYNDPAKATAQVVKRMMAETVAPLLDLGKRLEQDTNRRDAKDSYTELKSKFKNDKRFKDLLTQGEHIVDGVMSKMAPTEANMLGALYQIRGAIAAGDIELELGGMPAEQPNGNLRPSSAPQPDVQKKKLRELTESEKSEARKNKLTDAQYLAIMDTPDEVTFDHIDTALRTEKK